MLSEPDAWATELRISICHGITRKNTESKHTSFRAGCVSDGSFLRRRIQLFIAYLYKPEAQAKVLQIHVYYSHIIPSLALQAFKTRNTIKSRFPNPQLIAYKGARASSTSSGAGFLYGQWACRTGGWYQGPRNLCGMPAFALKGQNVIAQGNALGKCPNKTFSPERAKGFDIWLLRPFRAYLMGDLLPGVALRFTPGYHISPLRGLGTIARHSQCMLGIHGY